MSAVADEDRAVELLLVPSGLEFERLDTSALPAHVVVARCGVGPAEAARTSALLIEEFEPAACVLVGLAGTREAARAPLGAVVAGSHAVNEAVGAGAGAGFEGLHAMGLTDVEDVLELDPFPFDRPPDDVEIVIGPIGTVACASASAAEAAARRARHPGVLVEEMEGHAVAMSCLAADVSLAILRAVCNEAGDRDVARWELDRAFDALARCLARWAA